MLSQLENLEPSNGSAFNTPTEILLAKTSFTAFRLAYSPVNEVSQLSTTVFLGKIPDVWVGGPQTGLLFGTASRARNLFHRKFKSASSTVSESVRWFMARLDTQAAASQLNDGNDNEEISDFNFFYRQNQTIEQKFKDAYSTTNVLSEDISTEMPADDSNDSESDGISTEPDINTFPEEIVLNRELRDVYDDSLGSWDSSTASSLISCSPAPVSATQSRLIKRSCSLTTPNSPVDRFVGDEINKEPPKSSSLLLPLRNSDRASIVLSSSKVRFDVGSAPPKRSKITFAPPRPAQTQIHSLLDQQYVKAEKEHARMLKKLRVIASRSTGRAWNSGHRFKLKYVDAIMASYKAGEIIRVDLMLVMVQKVTSKRVAVHSESELGDTRILDRWKEYYAVLRKTEKLGLEIQFFEVSGGHDFNRKAEHIIHLSDHIKADFYSTSDKSICVIEKIEDGTMLYILNTRYVSIAYK